MTSTRWHYKGTGGGGRLSTEFEGWNDEKLDKYNIDLDTYDHTNIGSRPAVLINGYCNNRVPYLTAIHLWDKASDYLLSSRHDPVRIGRGEGGFDGSTKEVSSMSDSSPNSKKKARIGSKIKSKEPSTDGIAAVFRSIFDQMDVENDGKKKKGSDNIVVPIEQLSLPELYAMIEQHKLHLTFLKDNDMLVDGKKEDIVGKISYIFEIIESRSGKKRRHSPDGVSN